MAFAGVSVITDGKLLSTNDYPFWPTINACANSGYHLLVVQGHSRTVAPSGHKPIWVHSFTVGGHCWRILCYLDGTSSEDAGFMALYLHLDYSHTRSEPVKAQFEFSFVDETDKQDPLRIRASRPIFEFKTSSSNGYDRFVKREALAKSKHLRADSFTIRCDVVVLDPAPTCGTAPTIMEVPPSEMRQNFSDLLLAGEGTDVVFRVGGETIAAHRCVLAARSAVFKALLFGPMKEGSTTTSAVQIDDMDAAVFKALLGFIYGDSLPPEAVAEENGSVVLLQHLLVAADMYGLRRLRAMCEDRLCEHIGVNTAAAILALAEQHGCDGLKAACYEFLRCPANLRAVVATDGFDHLCRSCPPVMKDLILGMPQTPK